MEREITLDHWGRLWVDLHFPSLHSNWFLGEEGRGVKEGLLF